MKNPIRILLLVLLLAPLSAAGQPAGTAAGTSPPSSFDTAEIAFLEQFGREMAAEIAAGSSALFDAAFDLERFARRVVEGIDIPTETREGFLEGMLRGMRRSAGLLAGFLGQPYEFLRIHPWEGTPTLLFRLRPSDGGFNYHAYRFELVSTREVTLYDLHVLAVGEPLSRTLRRLALPGLVQQDRSLLDRLLGRERSFVDNMNKFRDMGHKVQAGEYEAALRVHLELPRDMREDKTVRLLEMNALVQVGGAEERYLEAIQQYREAFPDDPALPMIVLDYHIVTGDYDVAMGLIEEIEGWVGGDPYLDVMRVSAAFLGGRAAEAVQRVVKYLARYPDDEEARWFQVSAALSAKDHAVVREGLEYLEAHFEYVFTEESMGGAPEYADFLQSEEARRFLAGREPVEP